MAAEKRIDDLEQKMDALTARIEQLEMEQHLNKNVHIDNAICVPCNNKWQHWDRSRLEVSADGRTVKRRINDTRRWATVGAARPFCFQSSSHCQMRHRICYFEVKIVVKAAGIAIGLCDSNFPLFGECIGKKANSFAINSNGCVLMSTKANESCWQFNEGDVIGCGLEMAMLFFTRNGTICGNPIKMPASANGVELYPAVGLVCNDDQIEANFGGNFMYNLAKHNSMQQK